MDDLERLLLLGQRAAAEQAEAVMLTTTPAPPRSTSRRDRPPVDLSTMNSSHLVTASSGSKAAAVMAAG